MTGLRLAWPTPLLLAVSAVAALALFGVAAADPAVHHHGPSAVGRGSVAAFLVFVATWALMATAMMLPSATAFVAAMTRVAGGYRASLAMAAFVAGWAMVGVVLWLANLVAAPSLAGLAAPTAGAVAGLSLVGAALYQLSPLARRCQRACSRPFATIARNWGRRGSPAARALRTGAAYAATCIGCCVNMIAVMLVVGMSSPLWVLGLTGAMVVQKHAVWGPRVRVPMSGALCVYGLGVAVGVV